MNHVHIEYYAAEAERMKSEIRTSLADGMELEAEQRRAILELLHHILREAGATIHGCNP